MKVFFKTILLLIIIIFSVFSSVIFIMNRPTGTIPVTGFEFEVKQGYNTHKVGQLLKELGYIRSKTLFVAVVKFLRYEDQLKMGWFKIDSNSSTSKIINSIYNGSFITVSFMFPEGASIKQVNDVLIKNGIATKEEIEDFLSKSNYPSLLGLDGFKTIEGFLSPDTYKFNKGISVQSIYSAMIKLFYKKIEEIYPDYRLLTKKELYNKVILASIVEKEVRNHSESQTVAGVFYNRLKTKMKLQSCATVQYILDKPKEQLFESDLLIDNPYNTYLYMGLPPAPICNPGYNALKSVFYPEKNDFLFFVVKDPIAGTHYFSKTYQEHLQAQKKYKALKGF